MMGVIWELTWTNVVKIKTRKWNAQRWRMAKRAAIQAHVSWRVSWCCSIALSHFPSQNYFKTEKKITSRKHHILLLTDDRAEKRRIQEQARWRVSWSDSTTVSHFPRRNHFKVEKISTSRKFIAVFYYQRQSRDWGNHVVWLFKFLYVTGDTTWFSIHPAPTRGKIVFTPPRNI